MYNFMSCTAILNQGTSSDIEHVDTTNYTTAPKSSASTTSPEVDFSLNRLLGHGIVLVVEGHVHLTGLYGIPEAGYSCVIEHVDKGH